MALVGPKSKISSDFRIPNSLSAWSLIAKRSISFVLLLSTPRLDRTRKKLVTNLVTILQILRFHLLPPSLHLSMSQVFSPHIFFPFNETSIHGAVTPPYACVRTVLPEMANSPPVLVTSFPPNCFSTHFWCWRSELRCFQVYRTIAPSEQRVLPRG